MKYHVEPFQKPIKETHDNTRVEIGDPITFAAFRYERCMSEAGKELIERFHGKKAVA